MIEIKNRIMNIPNDEKSIGFKGDEKVETRTFKIQDDVSDMNKFMLNMLNSNDQLETIELEPVIQDGTTELNWTIDKAQTDVTGIMQIQLQAYKEDDGTKTKQWHSSIGRVQLKESL